MKKREDNAALWALFIVIALLVVSNALVMHRLNIMKLTAKASAQGTVQLVIESSAAPSPTPSPAAPSGGGGGSAPARSFVVDKTEIKERLKQGESAAETITITNTGETGLDFVIEMENLQDYAVLGSSSFSLSPKGSKALPVIFSVPEDTKPGIYAGRIIIRGAYIRKAVDVIITVESKRVLFDVKLEIPSSLKEVLAGSRVSAQITIFNLGELPELNATATYSILSIDNKEIIKEEGILKIEEQLSFSKSFVLPESLEPGTYIFALELTHEDGWGMSSDTFHVVSELEFPFKRDYIIYLVIIFIIIIFIIIMYLNYRRLKVIERKQRRFNRRIEEKEKR